MPTIGIGAGPSCDGQVLVFHDVLGLHDGHLPKFVRRYARLADVAVEALERFYADVDSGAFPGEDETYHMSEEAARMLVELEQAGPGWADRRRGRPARRRRHGSVTCAPTSRPPSTSKGKDATGSAGTRRRRGGARQGQAAAGLCDGQRLHLPEHGGGLRRRVHAAAGQEAPGGRRGRGRRRRRRSPSSSTRTNGWSRSRRAGRRPGRSHRGRRSDSPPCPTATSAGGPSTSTRRRRPRPGSAGRRRPLLSWRREARGGRLIGPSAAPRYNGPAHRPLLPEMPGAFLSGCPQEV